jgi:hypothetical protein
VFAALDMSIERCPAGEPARSLLEGAAAFAPEAVPLVWAYEIAGIEPATIEGKRALATLSGLKLVKVDTDAKTVSMHRLVHKRVRAKAEPEGWLEASRRGTTIVKQWMLATVGPARDQMAEVDARRTHVLNQRAGLSNNIMPPAG